MKTKTSVLVTGGSGFIGTRLVGRLLASGYIVRIYDKAISNDYPDLCVQGDVRDLNGLVNACKGVEAIYDLAAEHRDDVSPKSLYEDVNVNGAKNVCISATKNKITNIIFTSSVAIYKLGEGERSESGPIAPFNEYGLSKLNAEQVYLKWQLEDSGRMLCIVRPSVVFGEDNKGNVYNLIRQVARRRFIMVGNGKNRKSMAYVENVAAFLEHVLQLGAGQHILNYADKPDMDMNTLLDTIRRTLCYKTNPSIRLPYSIGYFLGMLAEISALILKYNSQLSAIRVKKFCANSQISAEKAFSYGFRPEIGLEKAIEQTIRAEFPHLAVGAQPGSSNSHQTINTAENNRL